MRRFRFRLERLLWHRRCQEELAAQALAGALRQERELARDLAQVRDHAARQATEVRAVLHRMTTGAEMVLHTRFATGLAGRQALLAQRREVAIETIRKRGAALRERRRASEVVAGLRERALARYRKAAEREAQLALDEAAGIRHARRVAEGAE